MSRPGHHAARSLVTLVMLLAACRRGDPPVAPSGVVTGTATGAGAATPAGPVETGPLGQVDATPEAGLSPAMAARRAQGLAAMDGGRFDLARQAFAEVLDAVPGNVATQALYDGATQALLAAQKGAGERFAGRTATVVAAPPWQYTLRRPLTGLPAGPPPKLALVSETANAISDDAEWFERNKVEVPEYEVPNPMHGEPGTLPPTIPPSFGKFLLIQAIRQDGHNILFYGPDYSGGRFVAVQREDTAEIVALLDFAAFARAPGAAAGEQRATWAAVLGGALIVSHAHRTYGRGAKGENAYLTAIDLASGELLWRTGPLVASAADFVVHGGYIVSGYGFTDEDDQLFVIDASTGKTVGKTRLKSGPDYLFLRSGKLYVRCYDTDYVFELRQGGR